jgi:uncharacterized protein (DUF58 family)
MLVLLLAIVIIGLVILEKHSLKNIFTGITYDMKPSVSMVEVDEEFFLESTIVNSKRLPITSLKTSELMPSEIVFEDKSNQLTTIDIGKVLTSTTYAMPRQKLTRSTKVSLPHRGRYFFYGANLTAGSFLGLSTREKRIRLLHEVILPPKPAQSVELEKMLATYLGDVSVTRFILEDPILTVGFREYTGREPMRSISWKQTAVAGELMVKNYDHTLDLTVTIILNVHTLNYNKKETFERLFSLARSVCEYLETVKTPYRFVTNVTTNNDINHRSIIPDGLGGAHLAVVKELLARATYNYYDNSEEMIAKIARGAEQGRSHILLTPDVSEAVEPFLRKLRARTGRKVLILTPD